MHLFECICMEEADRNSLALKHHSQETQRHCIKATLNALFTDIADLLLQNKLSKEIENHILD